MAETSRNEFATSMEEAQLEQSVVVEHINNGNMDGLKKMIYKYQNRIKDLHKTISKHKKTNDSLREELTQLNDTLNTLITKVTGKSKPEKQDHHKEEVIKKELDIEMRKNHVLKKEIDALKVKIKVYQSQKIGDLHNEIREKDRVIEDMHQSLKLHERFQKKDMNLDIYKKEEEAQKKINILTEEIGHLKKKTLDQRKMHDVQERSMLFQSRKMKQIETKQQSLPKTLKNDSQGPRETYQLLQQQNKIMKQKIQVFQKEKKVFDKFHKGQAQLWKNKLKTCEKNSLELKDNITKKDKEIQSLWIKIKSLNGNATDRETVSDEPAPTWITLLDCRRELKGTSNIRPGVKRFDDCEKLPVQKQYRISGLLFRYFQQHIIEMRITYDIKGETKQDKQQQTVSSFCISTHYQSTKQVSIRLSDYEYITEWENFLGKGIEYIRIRTSKQQTIEAGNERNHLKCKRLPFDIKTFEKPVACFGILDTKSVGQREREVLVALGLVLKRKNVFGGRAHSLARLQKPSLSLFSKTNNDKNVG